MLYKLELSSATVLCEIIDAGSVSAAAANLNTNVSSLSGTLGKLRKRFNNPLFFRSGSGMQPTALALELYEFYRPALNLFDEARKFEYSALQSQFTSKLRISAAPLMEFRLMEILLSDAMFKHDINWDIYAHPESKDAREDRLRKLQIDIDFGSALPANRAIVSYPLSQGGFQVICRREHPRLQGTVNLEQYQNEKIIGLISPHETIGVEIPAFSYVEDYLLHRDYRCSSATSLLCHVADNDMLVLVPASTADWLCKRFNLQVLKPDFAISGSFESYAHIHRVRKNDPKLIHLIKLMTNF